MIKAFNKKIMPRVYEAGDLVIKCIILPQGDPRGKWNPTYEGLFVVKRVFSGGAMMLTTMDGEDFPHPINADIVKNTMHKRLARLTHLGKIRASRKTKRFGQKLEIKKNRYTRQVENPKGRLGQKRVSRWIENPKGRFRQKLGN